jgi:hypothetical protein
LWSRTIAIIALAWPEFHDAMSGVIAELRNTETKTRIYSDAIFAELARWEEADRGGRRAVPSHYRIPGATHTNRGVEQRRLFRRRAND